MKKLLIIGTVLLLYTLSVKSQIQIGIKGGYNYFWILSSNESDPHNQTVFQPKENSFSIGCFIKDQTKKKFNPGIEIEYQWKSFRIVNNYGGLSGSVHSYNNFEIGWLNLYAKPSFSFGSKWKFIVNTGLYFSYMVNSHVSASRSSWIMGVTHDTTYEGNATQFINSTDLGIMAGIGIQVPVSTRFQILIENNYSMGLLNISKSNENGSLYNFLNAKFTVGVIYRIENARLISQKK
jgi:hypothetical protein